MMMAFIRHCAILVCCRSVCSTAKEGEAVKLSGREVWQINCVYSCARPRGCF